MNNNACFNNSNFENFNHSISDNCTSLSSNFLPFLQNYEAPPIPPRYDIRSKHLSTAVSNFSSSNSTEFPRTSLREHLSDGQNASTSHYRSAHSSYGRDNTVRFGLKYNML